MHSQLRKWNELNELLNIAGGKTTRKHSSAHMSLSKIYFVFVYVKIAYIIWLLQYLLPRVQ